MTATPDTAVLNLPARLETGQLFELKARLLDLRGGDLDLAGGEVERISGLGLQLLMAAFDTWSADGRALRIVDPSEALHAAFERAGFAPPGLDFPPHQEPTA